jgi:DNA repair protein RadC
MKEYIPKTLSIKSWAEGDQPREKLMKLGKKALTDAELLAIILGMGSKEESALALAQRILASTGGKLEYLGTYQVADYVRMFKGVGEAKAISIIAALELGMRRHMEQNEDRMLIKSSADAFKILYPKLCDLDVEHFYVLFLNRRNEVIQERHISKGGIHGTVVDVKVILKHALECQACGIVLAHNHPSGNLKPSSPDIKLTNSIKAATVLLEMTLIDHLIIAGKSYYSFADEGML